MDVFVLVSDGSEESFSGIEAVITDDDNNLTLLAEPVPGVPTVRIGGDPDQRELAVDAQFNAGLWVYWKVEQ